MARRLRLMPMATMTIASLASSGSTQAATQAWALPNNWAGHGFFPAKILLTNDGSASMPFAMPPW